MKRKLVSILLLLFIFCQLDLQAQSKDSQPQSDKDYLFTLKTPFGEIQLILFDDTPLHKQNFLKLVKDGSLNNTLFHRVIPNFMIQGGSCKVKGNPAPLLAEFTARHKHKRGAVAAARTPDEVNPQKISDPCQFYIVQNPSGTPFLDMNYTVFGQVISGFEIVDKIAAQPRDGADKPLKDIPMQVEAKLVSKSKIAEIYTLEQLYGTQAQ